MNNNNNVKQTISPLKEIKQYINPKRFIKENEKDSKENSKGNN